LIESSPLYGSETWRLTENNKRRVEATEMDALRRSSRISRKERIRNVTIRQQIGLEKTIVKEIEQNQLTWYGHVQRMAEGRLPKITLKWMPKQKRARGRPKKNWMEGVRKAMNKRLYIYINPACVIKSLNCCLAVSHIDDELTTFCPHYQGRFGETSRTAQKYKGRDLVETQVDLPWSHKIALRIPADGKRGAI